MIVKENPEKLIEVLTELECRTKAVYQVYLERLADYGEDNFSECLLQNVMNLEYLITKLEGAKVKEDVE